MCAPHRIEKSLVLLVVLEQQQINKKFIPHSSDTTLITHSDKITGILRNQKKVKHTIKVNTVILSKGAGLSPFPIATLIVTPSNI